MGTDFSRVRLDALLDYAGVELKQGAVLLDGDANELMDIVDRRLRALASDALGRTAVSSTTPDAFKIEAKSGDLEIGVGRLYVDGLLAECHGGVDPADRIFDGLLAEPKFAKPLPYAKQPYVNLAPLPPALPKSGRHLVYLDVWNREVTHLEEPELVEIAVGVEATSRIQTVWQVRLLKDIGGDTSCGSPDGDLPGWAKIIAPATGILTTDTVEVDAPENPCDLPPTGGYRGLENQLYRVEIHNPGLPGVATFKWSRDNASVGSRVASIVSGTELELDSLGRDDVLSFKSGDWVEITDDVREFTGKPGEIRQVTVDAAQRRITFAPALPGDLLPSPPALPTARNQRVRRWDQSGAVHRTDPGGTPVLAQDLDAAPPAGIVPGVIVVPPSTTTLILEHGVTVTFDPGADGFRSGDYWVFAARTADAKIEKLDHAPPRGIHHHYARLAIWDIGAGTVTDCRPKPETGHDCSCTACVTAESHLTEKLTIQAAVDKVKETGGTVCLGPGLYQLTEAVEIERTISLRIRGQGLASLILAPAGAFAISESLFTAIENLGIFSTGEQPAIAVNNAVGLSLTELIVGAVGRERGRGAAISLRGVVADATIAENLIFASTGIFADVPLEVGRTTAAPVRNILVAAALNIDDNIFLCGGNAVALDGSVFHFLGTRITGNEIVGCRDVAVSTTGFAPPTSSMTISRNDFWGAGDGIRCGLEAVWIEGNRLVNSEKRDNQSNAIMLVPGAGAGIGHGHILANQITDYRLAGIHVSTPVDALIVKQNIVERCGQGIVSSPTSKSGKICIENNQLFEVGPPETPVATATGIQVFQAESATIAGNTIRSLGLQPVGSTTCTGIFTLNVDRVRVLANEITNIGPPVFQGIVTGILLISPLLDFEVHHNRVEREAVPRQGLDGNWMALRVGEAAVAPVTVPPPRGVPASTTSLFSARILNLNLLTVNDSFNDFFAFSIIRPSPPSGSILGNVIKARGLLSAVDVRADDCLFNDNRVEAGPRAPAVMLSARITVASANRVFGGSRSIVVNGTSAAMVGNITSGGIDATPPLATPFGPLNLIA